MTFLRRNSIYLIVLLTFVSACHRSSSRKSGDIVSCPKAPRKIRSKATRPDIPQTYTSVSLLKKREIGHSVKVKFTPSCDHLVVSEDGAVTMYNRKNLKQGSIFKKSIIDMESTAKGVFLLTKSSTLFLLTNGVLQNRGIMRANTFAFVRHMAPLLVSTEGISHPKSPKTTLVPFGEREIIAAAGSRPSGILYLMDLWSDTQLAMVAQGSIVDLAKFPDLVTHYDVVNDHVVAVCRNVLYLINAKKNPVKLIEIGLLPDLSKMAGPLKKGPFHGRVRVSCMANSKTCLVVTSRDFEAEQSQINMYMLNVHTKAFSKVASVPGRIMDVDICPQKHIVAVLEDYALYVFLVK